jgi:5-methylcytosine-specific restriction endonuclease McrA
VLSKDVYADYQQEHLNRKRGISVSSPIHRPVLVLNQSYEPINICAARRAIVLLLKGVASYEEEHDHEVHLGMKVPSVIRLREYKKIPHRAQKVTREGIYTRDNNTCQYCGGRFARHDLTLDHILPKSRGGSSKWENLVACCRKCNHTKADRTPEEAGMTLLHRPLKNTIHTARGMMRLRGMHEQKWHKYIYVDAA